MHSPGLLCSGLWCVSPKRRAAVWWLWETSSNYQVRTPVVAMSWRLTVKVMVAQTRRLIKISILTEQIPTLQYDRLTYKL